MGFSNMDYLMEELGDVLTDLIVLERQRMAKPYVFGVAVVGTAIGLKL